MCLTHCPKPHVVLFWESRKLEKIGVPGVGYNISEVSGNFMGTGIIDIDDWEATADLHDPSVTIVTGDFDQTSGGGGDSPGGYVFSPLSTTDYGILTYNTTDGTFTFTIDRDAVKASGTDQSVTFTITGTSGSRTDTDTVTINILICVNRGTLIETEGGPSKVEDLGIGDFVKTLDSGLQPICWIGSRRISGYEIARDPSLRPIRITAGALGDETPSRDLLVSPQHRILLSDWRAEYYFAEQSVLAPAKGLLNDHSILIESNPGTVEYFHILFDNHQIIFTEGALSESFHPGPYSMREIDSDARCELLSLFPDLEDEKTGYGPAARLALKPKEALLFRRATMPGAASL